jgi:hypothetical protein
MWCYVVCRRIAMFRRNLMPLSSGYRSPILNTVAAGSSKMLLMFYQITWHHIPGDSFHLFLPCFSCVTNKVYIILKLPKTMPSFKNTVQFTQNFPKITEPMRWKSQMLLVSAKAAQIWTASITDIPRTNKAYQNYIRCWKWPLLFCMCSL